MNKFKIPYEMNGRPLKLIHNFPFAIDDGREKRHEIIDATLERLYRLGYGGIVTNVDTREYLENDENWDSLRYAVGQAKAKRFRVWLYDEDGYPSGGAGGITLRDHPECEARALALVTAKGDPGETVNIELPRGHEYFLETPGVTLVGSGETARVKADNEGIARAYAVKRLYEGTHAQHNVYESRRYINVLDNAATEAFIDNTYEAYRRELGELFQEIEGIFTDEPSIMAAYINAGLYPKRVHDQFDDTLTLLPIVVWEDKLPERYEEKWGEPLLPKLDDLFGPKTPEKADTRYKFFSVTSEMYESAFFRQLGDWCEQAGTNFSGHVLLEEEILHHPLFEGNIFRFIGHMGIPGIDMLTTIPAGVLRQAPTPKLISSAAHFNGLTEVMSEVSGHMEGASKRQFGVNEMKGSVATQRALGVTIFPSYYNDTLVTEAEFQDFCRFSGNICRLTDSSETSGVNAFILRRTLLLYPVEAAFSSSSGLGPGHHTDDERRLEASWQRINRKLLLAGTEYEIVDTRALLKEMHIEKGQVIDRFGRSYKAVVIPFVNYETPEFKMLRQRLNDAGVFTVADNEGSEQSADGLIRELMAGLAEVNVYPAGEFEPADAQAGGKESPLIISSYFDTRHFDLAFLAVNYTDAPVSGTLTLNIPSWTGITPEAHTITVDPDDGIFTHQIGTFGERAEAHGSLERSELTFTFDINIRPMGALVVGFNR